MIPTRRFGLAFAALGLCLFAPPALYAQAQCEFSAVPGAVWWGTKRQMTLDELASYIAPVYWFSPDEPLLEGKSGADIRVPEALPFETPPDAPVVYYQVEELVLVPGEEPGYVGNAGDKGQSVIDLERVGAIKISYFAYFHAEVGLGAHPHDLEATEFKVIVPRNTTSFIADYTDAQCDEKNYILLVTRVSAKAHGIQWFWNVLNVDAETKFPMFIFVEEGKHGLSTDKNSDGYFTPGYDVNRHINDAWGVRDVIRSGSLFSGGYQAWMTKVRHPQDRVFPPLPEDSPLRDDLERRGEYAFDNVEYELRAFPSASLGEDDPGLHHFMKDKEVPGWPRLDEGTELQDFIDWMDADQVVKSLAISAYNDGDWGFSWVFPFFIVKNFEVSLSGGFLVWRMYLKDDSLQDFGWMAMYTPSASRWFDTYFAAGAEWDREVVDGERQTKSHFVLETGLKFRVNISTSPFKFLGLFTDFWGFRAGIKNYGFSDIDRLTYVLELGAGAF
jgi:hypothetical protein